MVNEYNKDKTNQKPYDQVGAPRATKGGVPQKYLLDDRGRKMINDLYDGSSERIDLLARQLRLPRKVIKRFAHQLGKTKSKTIWTPEEEDFLKRNIHRMPMNKLTKHLHRHKATIEKKAHALGLYREYEGSGYTLADLIAGFGFAKNANNSIYSWIDKGWLKGRKIITKFKTEQWEFSCKDIRKFIHSHPEQLNPHRFDWLWVADILAGDNGLGRLDENYERIQEYPSEIEGDQRDQ